MTDKLLIYSFIFFLIVNVSEYFLIDRKMHDLEHALTHILLIFKSFTDRIDFESVIEEDENEEYDQ